MNEMKWGEKAQTKKNNMRETYHNSGFRSIANLLKTKIKQKHISKKVKYKSKKELNERPRYDLT